MEFDIKKVSEAEHDLICSALEDYGESFENANALVVLFWRFISRYEGGTFPFQAFLSLARKSISLSLISIIRKHDIQCQNMMRQYLETSVLAAYAMKEKGLKEFGKLTSDGLLQENKKVLGDAYKWLEKDYKETPDKIHGMKKAINELAAHANIVSATNNAFELDSICDVSQNHIIEQRLWWVGNMIIGISCLLGRVNQDYNTFESSKDFKDELKKLFAQNEKIKNILIQEPGFKKWIDKTE